MLKKVIRKTVLIYTIFGLIVGIGLLIASFFSDEIVFQSGEKVITRGVNAGLISVPASVLIASFVGLMHAIFLWFPIVYIYKKLSNRKT
ncbi:hypothetical protein FE784_23890 [Paenibacillus hemerocallicola]|uniref:Uncharacterized protein n=1 Tax=Paenibacillus hemerocallicola TaxID=1172614 RepID=A0A5C4T4P8_9BACL|nr:hypothetical protein [Paenibacillus hemerocallicola]TNJ63765.1 hypothetical protein FE784_23890 [Paenibacillus hemerocallicola]